MEVSERKFANFAAHRIQGRRSEATKKHTVCADLVVLHILVRALLSVCMHRAGTITCAGAPGQLAYDKFSSFAYLCLLCDDSDNSSDGQAFFIEAQMTSVGHVCVISVVVAVAVVVAVVVVVAAVAAVANLIVAVDKYLSLIFAAWRIRSARRPPGSRAAAAAGSGSGLPRFATGRTSPQQCKMVTACRTPPRGPSRNPSTPRCHCRRFPPPRARPQQEAAPPLCGFLAAQCAGNSLPSHRRGRRAPFRRGRGTWWSRRRIHLRWCRD